MTTATSCPAAGVPTFLSDFARRYPRVAGRLTVSHAAVVHGSRRRLAARWFGTPVLLLQTVGRRTGLPRSMALLYLPDGDDWVVVAFNAGAERPPGWWLKSLLALRRPGDLMSAAIHHAPAGWRGGAGLSSVG